MTRPSPSEPKKHRVFVVVSRQVLIDSRFSTVICAPVYSTYEGLSTQVPVGIKEGLKHDSSIYCDGLVSLPKTTLTDYLAMLSDDQLRLLDRALLAALGRGCQRHPMRRLRADVSGSPTRSIRCSGASTT